MKIPIAILLLVAVGCGQQTRAPSSGTSNTNDTNKTSNAANSSTSTPPAADNTGINTRDRDDAAVTPIDQNENQQDIDVTAGIRKRIMDANLSVNASNVKIMTQDGNVTLRGPVNSEDEKNQIERLAKEQPGAKNVANELEIVENKENK
jgi:hyperosmotically inducible protein